MRAGSAGQFVKDRAGGAGGVGVGPDRTSDDDVIGAIRDCLRRGRHAFLVAEVGPGGAHARRHDQAALRFGQGADHGGLLRRGDDTIGPGLESARGAFGDKVGDEARTHQTGIEIVAVERCEDRHCQNLHVAARRALARGAHDMRVAMHGQEIEIELRQPAHRLFHCRADIKELHVQKDALAMFLLELIGQPQTATGQHPEADLVEGHVLPQHLAELERLKRVGNIEGDNQAVIGHGAGLWLLGHGRG